MSELLNHPSLSRWVCQKTHIYNFMRHFTLIRLWLNYYFLHTSCLSIPLNALLNLFFSNLPLQWNYSLYCVRLFFPLDSWIRPSKYLLHVGLASNTSCITLDFLRYLHEWLSEHTCFIPQPHLPCCQFFGIFATFQVNQLTAQLRLFI